MPKTLVAEKLTATHIYPSLIDDVNAIPDIIKFSNPIILYKAKSLESRVYIINWKHGRKWVLLIL